MEEILRWKGALGCSLDVSNRQRGGNQLSTSPRRGRGGEVPGQDGRDGRISLSKRRTLLPC